MAAGIALMNPALPSIVRDWMPDRVGFGTAVYSNGLPIGQLLAVWLTIPFILPLLAGRWGLALGSWAIPVFITFLLVAAWVRKDGRPEGSAPRFGWRPNWKDPLVGNSASFSARPPRSTSSRTSFFPTTCFTGAVPSGS